MQNLDKLKEYDFKLSVNSVFQKDNSLEFVKIADWLYNQNINTWIVTTLINPSELKWTNGPKLSEKYLTYLLRHPLVKKNLITAMTVKSLIDSVKNNLEEK